MNFHQFLHEGKPEILAQAVERVGRAHLEHYEKVGTDRVRQRLDDLLSLTIDAVRDRNLAPVVAHANAVAQERFEGGVDLSEVQRAYNVLEEVIWWRILKHLPAEQQGEALGLVGTVLGTGKDTLARKYVSLATRVHTPSLDLKAMFSGTEGI